MGRAQGQPPAPPASGEATVQATFDLPEDESESVRQLAESRHTTPTQVLRQAIVTEQYLQELADNKSHLLAQFDHGPRQEVIFPQTTDS